MATTLKPAAVRIPWKVAEQQRQFAARLSAKPAPVSEPIHRMPQSTQERLKQASMNWERRQADYRRIAGMKLGASRQKMAELRREFREPTTRLHAVPHDRQKAQRLAQTAEILRL